MRLVTTITPQFNRRRDMNGKYIPSGKLQGDVSEIPDRGTSTGVVGGNYGADLSVDATNRHGRISGATGSDEGSCFCDRSLNEMPSGSKSDGTKFNGRIGG